MGNDVPDSPPLVRPSVVPKHRGVRPLFWIALALSLTIAVLVATRMKRAPVHNPAADDWFSKHKGHCNSVEAMTYLRNNDPGTDSKGVAYRAGCLALAGKIDAAREAIEALRAGDRDFAVGFVFQVGHPVADAGDDESAGPIMELVLEFQPDQYMALYHAGMAQAIGGNDDRARKHLTRFLEVYRVNDGWTRNARAALESLQRPRIERTVKPGGEGNIIY